MVELSRLKPFVAIYPGAQPFGSSAYLLDEHPLGLTGQMTIVTAVRDVAAASETYQGLMGGVEVPTAWSDGRRAFQVGDDKIVALVASNSPELGGFGDGRFGMAFNVAAIAAAELDLQELARHYHRGAKENGK